MAGRDVPFVVDCLVICGEGLCDNGTFMVNEIDPCELFGIKTGMCEDCLVVHVAGTLDHCTAAIFHEQVEQAWGAAESAALVLDLSEVDFFDASGLNVLLMLLRRGLQSKSALILSGLPFLMDAKLKILRIRGVFAIEPDVPDAIRAARSHAA